MKKFLPVFLVVVVLAALFVTPVFALQGAEPDSVSDPVQLFLIGTIASVLVYGIKLVSERMPDVVIKREWLTIFVYMISLALAAMWRGATLPYFPGYVDPVSFVSNLLRWVADILVALGPSVGFATLIYNVLLARVLDGLAAKAGLKKAA